MIDKMSNEYFQYLIDNQDFWRDLAIEQDKKAASIRKQERNAANWYGNSKEYKKTWDLNNKRHKSESKWNLKNGTIIGDNLKQDEN